jgi:hypothetical protein
MIAARGAAVRRAGGGRGVGRLADVATTYDAAEPISSTAAARTASRRPAITPCAPRAGCFAEAAAAGGDERRTFVQDALRKHQRSVGAHHRRRW